MRRLVARLAGLALLLGLGLGLSVIDVSQARARRAMEATAAGAGCAPGQVVHVHVRRHRQVRRYRDAAGRLRRRTRIHLIRRVHCHPAPTPVSRPVPTPRPAVSPPATPESSPASAPPIATAKPGPPVVFLPTATPVPEPPVAPPSPPQPAPPTPEPTPPAPVPVPLAYLQVTAREFSYSLSRPSILAGPIAVELVNAGEDDHDLRLRRQDSSDAPLDLPTTDPGGGTSAATLELSAGTWRLWCSIGDHADRGMRAKLIVAPRDR